MPKASPLAIATRTVVNYCKDATSYYAEYQSDVSAIAKAQSSAEDELGNKSSTIAQLEKAKEQTRTTYLGYFHKNEKRSLPEAVERLREEIEKVQEKEEIKEEEKVEIEKANEAVKKAEELIKEGAKLAEGNE